jgi:hypothetical protein
MVLIYITEKGLLKKFKTEKQRDGGDKWIGD